MTILLATPVSLNNYIIHRPPKIPEIRDEGMFFVSVEVFEFGGDDLLDGFGFIDIIGGDEAGFVLDALLLQLGGIELEVLAAQGPHAEELHLAPHQVNQHGHLIEPEDPHDLSQG